MRRLLLLVALPLLGAALKSEVYSFPASSVTCTAAVYGNTFYNIQSCTSGLSVANADGTYLSFDIRNGSLSFTQFGGEPVPKYFSGSLPITVEFGGMNLIFKSTEALGAFTMRNVGCSGGTRGSPTQCQYSSVGYPSGTLILTSSSQ